MPAGQDMQHWSERDLPSEPPSLSVVLLRIFTISQERGCACVRTRIHAQVIQPISQDRLPDPISTPSGTLLISASLYMDRRKCAKQSAQYNVRRTNMLMTAQNYARRHASCGPTFHPVKCQSNPNRMIQDLGVEMRWGAPRHVARLYRNVRRRILLHSTMWSSTKKMRRRNSITSPAWPGRRQSVCFTPCPPTCWSFTGAARLTATSSPPWRSWTRFEEDGVHWDKEMLQSRQIVICKAWKQNTSA